MREYVTVRPAVSVSVWTLKMSCESSTTVVLSELVMSRVLLTLTLKLVVPVPPCPSSARMVMVCGDPATCASWGSMVKLMVEPSLLTMWSQEGLSWMLKVPPSLNEAETVRRVDDSSLTV